MQDHQESGHQHVQEQAAAPAAGVFKRPTPSISTLLASVPAIHGKLPPLRASAECERGARSKEGAAKLAGPGHSLTGHEPLGQELQQSHAAQQEHLSQQEQLQVMQEQQHQTQLQGPAAHPPAVALGQEQQAAEQGYQQQQPHQQQLQKVSWASALRRSSEFFMRVSHLQPAPAAAQAADLAPWHSSLQHEQAALEQPTSNTPQQQQEQEQQQQQQFSRHWWQGRPSNALQQRTSAVNIEQPRSSSDSSGSGSSSSNRWASRRLRLLQLLDSPIASWVLIAMSLFVIFQEDFKYAVLPPTADLWFESITLALLITFLIEISLSCLVRPGFFLSFYFWLDTVAVLSLAFELPALRAVLLLGETQEYVNLNNSDSYLMAAGAQALVSSKAGRAAKMMRLFRQLQLIRIFRQLELRQRLKRVLAEGAVAPDGLTATQAEVLGKYKHSESRVGQRLSDLTTKRVISGILAMLLVLPALEITSGINGATASLSLGGLEMLHMQALTGGTGSNAFNASVQAFTRSIEYKLAGQTTGGILRLVLANTTYVNNPAYSSIGAGKAPGSSSSSKQTSKEYRRYLEMQAAYFHSWLCPSGSPIAASAFAASPAAEAAMAAWGLPGFVIIDAAVAEGSVQGQGGVDVASFLWQAGCQHMQSFILLDIKWSLQAQSVYGIARTLFLVCLLGLGSYLIHSDTYRLVLQPVQRMVERVREMAEDPLMLAAVRNSPPAGPSGTTGTAEAPSRGPDSCNTSSSGGSGGAKSSVRESVVADKAQAARASAVASGSSDGSSKGVKTRFWPSVRVHAIADTCTDSPGAGAAAAWPAHKQQQEQHMQTLTEGSVTEEELAAAAAARPRASSMVAQARRLSARLGAGMSAAGRAADRLRVQLMARAAAIKQLLVVDVDEGQDKQGQYETRLLEQSIYKICALLAVGFGDAGAEVISENIRKEGDLNPCVPGKKTVAVFGFCDIRRFTDTTEVLQEGVMEFVNVIAHLVHGAVAARGGAANKNIGDAFLLVWKLPKGLDDKDVSLLSSGGAAAAAGSPRNQLAPVGTSKALRTAALNWPGLSEDEGGSNTEDPQQHHSGSSIQQHAPLPGAACSPRDSRSSSPERPPGGSRTGSGSGPGALVRPVSFTQAAADREISNMLQQHHTHLTIKRAASGVMDGPLPGMHKRHSGGNGSANSSASGGAAVGSQGGGSSADGQQEHAGAAGLSGPGLRRAMLSIKSVAATPLSDAAKASIINTIADSALASFVVIQVAIAVSRVLKAYSSRADLNARMPGFRVQMGFGLHVGWAIEGAIGSEYKIDASYLSPNVNLASRLEAATKQYSVPMLLSRDFVDCLSPAVRSKVRQIDCVTVKGSNQPLGLFCYDLDLAAAEQELQVLAANSSSSSSNSGARLSTTTSHARNLLAAAAGDAPPSLLQGGSVGSATASAAAAAAAAATGTSSMPAVGAVRHSLAVLPDAACAARTSVVVSAGRPSISWNREELAAAVGPDPAEVLLSQEYDDDWVDNPVVARSWAIDWDFKEAFDEAFEDYLAGRWPEARQSLEELLWSRRAPDGTAVEDPPTKTLLGVMAGHDYVAPADWQGFRELTEK